MLAIYLAFGAVLRLVRLCLALGTEEPGCHACNDDHYEADDDAPAAREKNRLARVAGMGIVGSGRCREGQRVEEKAKGVVPICHGA